MKGFCLLHHEIGKERPNRRFSRPVVKAPCGQVPAIWSTGPPEADVTAKWLCETPNRSGWTDLSRSDVDPAVRANHPSHSLPLDPEISGTVYDTGEITEQLLSGPSTTFRRQ